MKTGAHLALLFIAFATGTAVAEPALPLVDRPLVLPPAHWWRGW